MKSKHIQQIFMLLNEVKAYFDNNDVVDNNDVEMLTNIDNISDSVNVDDADVDIDIDDDDDIYADDDDNINADDDDIDDIGVDDDIDVDDDINIDDDIDVDDDIDIDDNDNNTNSIKIYGISQNPNTKDYIIVLQDVYCKECGEEYADVDDKCKQFLNEIKAYSIANSSKILKCWDSNPNNRPNADEIQESIYLFENSYNQEFDMRKQQYYEINKQFNEAEKYRKLHFSFEDNRPTHPKAVYTARLLNPYTKKLPKYDDKIYEFSDDMVVELLKDGIITENESDFESTKPNTEPKENPIESEFSDNIAVEKLLLKHVTELE
ncbi:unnamed protein product [Rhizophagus irregularis]|uniref:Uncharacterized protein n=1 Tax=Rhizophagus irregularis TaxID=588596 RepID=A0A915ZHE9_9GLOM|nr:unnamed protein product [Rhizophagus irregularis]